MWHRRCCFCRYNGEENDIDLSKLQLLKVQYPDLILLDVRSPQEYEEGHMQGSICIPSYDILRMAEKILTNKQTVIVAYCEFGARSRKTVNLLKTLGYKNVYNLIK